MRIVDSHFVVVAKRVVTSAYVSARRVRRGAAYGMGRANLPEITGTAAVHAGRGAADLDVLAIREHETVVNVHAIATGINVST